MQKLSVIFHKVWSHCEAFEVYILVAYLLLSERVREFWKSINININLIQLGQKLCGLLFGYSLRMNVNVDASAFLSSFLLQIDKKIRKVHIIILVVMRHTIYFGAA